MQPIDRRTRSPRLALVVLASLAFLALGQGWAQVTTETADLLGPVATVSEFLEYPDTTERNLSSTWSFRLDGTAAERVYFSYSFRDGSLRSRTVTTYDAEGKRMGTLVLDPDGATLGRTEYRYDARGHLIEETVLDAEGNETRRVTYERDGDGNAVVRERYVDGVLDERREREFDAQGRELEERAYEDGRLVEVETYTVPGMAADFVEYDEEGDVESTGTFVDGEHGTERWVGYDADGNLEYEIVWTYDEHGLVLERSEVYGTDTSSYAYEYEFDEAGNWIRMVVTETFGDMPSAVYEIRDRQITYH